MAGAESSVLIQGRVGEVLESIGGEGVIRLGRSREVIVASLRGRFHEAAVSGRLYIASIGVAGVAPGTALSTTPPMAIWNPLNSNVLASIQQVWVSYISGTLGAGSLVHAQVPTQGATAPTTGTELTVVPALLSGLRASVRAFTGSTVAATPTIVRPSMLLGAGLATTATFPAVAMDEVDGGIVVPPGGCWVYQGVAAVGTSPLVLIGVVYEEVPIPM